MYYIRDGFKLMHNVKEQFNTFLESIKIWSDTYGWLYIKFRNYEGVRSAIETFILHVAFAYNFDRNGYFILDLLKHGLMDLIVEIGLATLDTRRLSPWFDVLFEYQQDHPTIIELRTKLSSVNEWLKLEEKQITMLRESEDVRDKGLSVYLGAIHSVLEGKNHLVKRPEGLDKYNYSQAFLNGLQ